MPESIQNEITYDHAMQLYSSHNWKSAFNAFKQLADIQGKHAQVHYMLGKMTMEGHGTHKDERAAIDYYKTAASLGDTDAMYSLGILYMNGTVCTHKSLATSEKYLKLAIQRNNCAACLALARLYAEHPELNADIDTITQLADKAIMDGKPSTETEIGNIYAIMGNYSKAVSYYDKAAQQNEPNAMRNLGTYYRYGKGGIPENIGIALDWYQKSFNAGNSDAALDIANIYYSGEGVERDYRQALEWRLKAASMDNTEAMYYIGLTYLNGAGVKIDIEEAVWWLHNAFKREYVDAGYILCEIYCKGMGVQPDCVKAIAYWKLLIKIKANRSLLYTSKDVAVYQMLVAANPCANIPDGSRLKTK